MNARRLLGLALVLGISCCGFGQQRLDGTMSTQRSQPDSNAVKQKLLDTVAAYEAMTRKVEQAHTPDLGMARAYWHLGVAYEDAGEIGRSEAALTHSVALFRRSDTRGGELAEALDSLAVIHTWMQKMQEGVREEQEALELREKLGDRLEMARSWSSMAAIKIQQKKFGEARDFAQKAVDEFASDRNATLADGLAARYALGMALCREKNYAAAVPVLRNAVGDAKAALSAQDMPVGIGEFLLGYAYWRSGDMTDAGPEMKTGVTSLETQLGWGAPSYVTVLKLYAKYLHEMRDAEEASNVERRIQQAESVVSVGALQSSAGVFGFDGLR